MTNSRISLLSILMIVVVLPAWLMLKLSPYGTTSRAPPAIHTIPPIGELWPKAGTLLSAF